MESLIRQIENWQSKTAGEILSYFSENVSQNVTEDYTVAKLINLLGEDSARIVVGTIQQAAAVDPLMGPTLNALSVAPGIQLYTDDRQAGIDQLAALASWPNELTQAVKALGRRTLTRWAEVYGEIPLPTTDEIAAVVAEIESRVFNQKQILLSVNSGVQTVISLAVTPMAADGTLDSDNTQRIVLSNGVLVGNPTEQQATAVAALVSLVDSLKG